MTKIIFLDIDGVLNCADENIEHIHELNGEYHLHAPELVKNLNKLISLTKAKVVVSSTWRLGETTESLQKLLLLIGVKCEVIGKTDHLGFNSWIMRGNEIFKWIKDHEDICGNYWEFKDYVILDDDSDMLLWQKDNFVHIDANVGLTMTDVDQAVNILMG